MLKKSRYRGITIGNAIEVFLLMYADGIVLVGNTVLELQRKINILEIFLRKVGYGSKPWKLKLWFSEKVGKHLSQRDSSIETDQ